MAKSSILQKCMPIMGPNSKGFSYLRDSEGNRPRRSKLKWAKESSAEEDLFRAEADRTK